MDSMDSIWNVLGTVKYCATRWIPLGINPFANLMAVFFTGLEEEIEVEEEDITEPLEMYIYAH